MFKKLLNNLFGKQDESSLIIFQIHKLNFKSSNLSDFIGKVISEIKVDGHIISGNDLVSDVKNRIKKEINLSDQDKATFYFNGSCMEEDKLFYASHFILLPAWVQVLIHNKTEEDVVKVIDNYAESPVENHHQKIFKQKENRT